MDLLTILELAGKNLIEALSKDDNYLPYWHMVVDENCKAEYQFRPHCTGHNVGRWWNAMLRLEKSIGFEIPEPIERAMVENSWNLSDNPTGIFLDDINPKDQATWYIHSYRETMLSFGLLAGIRKSNKARALGCRAIEAMRSASQDLTSWKLPSSFPLRKTGKGGEPAYTHGRAIEGLVCFYESTGHSIAIEEATRLSEFHHKNLLRSDGELAHGCGHHTHSYLNTIRGLLLMPDAERTTIEAIQATYRNAISKMITRSGFVTHDIGAVSGGDIASAGDIAHIALLLWDKTKNSDFLDDIERIVRSRLAPAQAKEAPPLIPFIDDSQDCHNNLPERFVGSIGGAVGHVKGQTCVTDFTASALHSLIEFYDRSVYIEDDTVWILFHFNRDLPEVSVTSARKVSRATVSIINKTPRKVFVRVPNWVKKDSICLLVNGVRVNYKLEKGFISVDGEVNVTHFVLSFSLFEVTLLESSMDSNATNEQIAFSWRGDEIVDVDVGGPYLRTEASVCRSSL